ncbi:MAG: hypothetical protein KF758_13340 [Anaerolineales bacterium]|nr:hypothetical protein [Anaerolineales bacterium]
MMKKLRLFLAIIILTISISLLIWGFLPSRTEIRIQEISPQEMQLPTPSSYNAPIGSVTLWLFEVNGGHRPPMSIEFNF